MENKIVVTGDIDYISSAIRTPYSLYKHNAVEETKYGWNMFMGIKQAAEDLFGGGHLVQRIITNYDERRSWYIYVKLPTFMIGKASYFHWYWNCRIDVQYKDTHNSVYVAHAGDNHPHAGSSRGYLCTNLDPTAARCLAKGDFKGALVDVIGGIATINATGRGRDYFICTYCDDHATGFCGECRVHLCTHHGNDCVACGNSNCNAHISSWENSEGKEFGVCDRHSPHYIKECVCCGEPTLYTTSCGWCSKRISTSCIRRCHNHYFRTDAEPLHGCRECMHEVGDQEVGDQEVTGVARYVCSVCFVPEAEGKVCDNDWCATRRMRQRLDQFTTDKRTRDNYANKCNACKKEEMNEEY